VGKPEEKRPLARPARRWDDNIKIDTQHNEGVNWIYLAQGRHNTWNVVNTAMNYPPPRKIREFFDDVRKY
jgi:hypothetical protein